MSQAMLTVRVNIDDKNRFEDFCSQVGLNVSTCINMFVKAVLREQKIPFEVKADSFYGKDNYVDLKSRVEDLKAGYDIVEHG